MTLLFLSTLAIFPWQTSAAPRQLVHCSTHSIEIPAMLMNSSTLPVRVDSARAECSLGQTSLDYSVSNTSKQHIHRIEFRIFILDPAGRVLEVKEGSSTTEINGGSTKRDRVLIKGMLEQNSRLLFAVNKVITDVGVWQIDDPSLEELVRKQLFEQPDTGISATFEANAIVSGLERSQIFKLIMSDLISDEAKIEKLRGQSELIVLSNDIDFPVPEIPHKRLLLLSEKQIQDVADQQKRVVFLKYEPLRVEGSRVFAKMAVRDAVPRKRSAFVQYKYAFLYICSKRGDQWVIEKSLGYAQS